MNHFRCVALAAAIAAAALLGCGADSSAAEPTKKTVTLVVDYGDGVQKHFTAIAWREELTVLDALLDAGKHARGVAVHYRGTGETAFVEKIDDLANEGRGRNWTFRVNGQLARKSCGIYRLEAGDAVLWKFGEYR